MNNISQYSFLSNKAETVLPHAIQTHERPKFIFLIPLETGVSMNEIRRAVRPGWNGGEIGTHEIQDYYTSLIKAYVASHFGRFAFEVGAPEREAAT